MLNLGSKKAFLFDLDNTLYPYEPCHQKGLARAKALFVTLPGSARNDFFTEYRKARSAVARRHRCTAASHSRLLYFRRLCEQIFRAHRVSYAVALHDAYWEGYFTAMILDRFAKPILNSLRQRGIRIGLVTDLAEEVQLRKILRLKLVEHLDVVVTSEEAGREKPNPKIFLAALRRLRVSPARGVMVGDDYERDIQGAKRLGLSTVWVTPDPRNGPAKPAMADLTVRSLRELYKIL